MRNRFLLVLLTLAAAFGCVAMPQPAHAEYLGAFTSCSMLATPTAPGGTSYVGVLLSGPVVLPPRSLGRRGYVDHRDLPGAGRR